MMPKVDLPEVLLEMNALTGFAEAFTHISAGISAFPTFTSASALCYSLNPAISV